MMADLLITNVEDGTADGEIKEFLIKYGFPAFDKIERVPGTGSSPSVLLTFNELDEVVLRTLQPRIHNMFWKNRTITVGIMREYGH
jgi:hypothetical protein